MLISKGKILQNKEEVDNIKVMGCNRSLACARDSFIPGTAAKLHHFQAQTPFAHQ